MVAKHGVITHPRTGRFIPVEDYKILSDDEVLRLSQQDTLCVLEWIEQHPGEYHMLYVKNPVPAVYVAPQDDRMGW